MSGHQKFCAIESVNSGDPLAGTGTHPERNLLISWPRRKWSRSLRIATDMNPELQDQVETMAEAGRRVNLIHRRGWPERLHRLYLFPENLCFDIKREALSEFLDALRAGRSLAKWTPKRPSSNLILCCTHGKKDKCCAKFGYTTYRALVKEAEHKGSEIDIWESSHLGGCRLAASVVVFPALRKYGRISQEDVGSLVEHEAAGRIYLPCYRGSSILAPVQQCAETAALRWLEEQKLAATLAIGETVHNQDGSVVVPIRWHHANEIGGILEARCETREVYRPDTCANLDEDPTASECWFVTRLAAR
ncbi:sucrase ferredoxin [Marinobacter sp.]|uniref:sucrase ferredoxin n=1 Tax=Marinobacter sp. TaxID=50741 RepID=UPI002354FD39|nr:sucrase ferredoxin [Marinobacter sp.]